MSLVASELRRLRRESTRINRKLALAHVEGVVAEVDEQAWKVRVEIATDEDGKPVLSPWVKFVAKSAGAYADSPPLPAKGDRMRLLSPSGIVGAASYAVPSAFDDELKRPDGQKTDESVRAYGKTRVTMKKDSLTQATEKTSIAQTKENIAVKADKKAEIEGEEARVKAQVSRIHADSLDKLKLIIGDQAYQIRPEALLPTSA
jgi:phage baseplate assembly protein gpV